MTEYPLFKKIIKLSEADIWEVAKLEWTWIDTYFIDEGEDYETCLCGHYPIKECCVIQNKKNGTTVMVGNCCINKFMETESDLIFQCIRRIQVDITKSLNPATIEYAYEKCAISAWEYKFYRSIGRKRKLTFKQETVKIRINEAVLRKFRKGSDRVAIAV